MQTVSLLQDSDPNTNCFYYDRSVLLKCVRVKLTALKQTSDSILILTLLNVTSTASTLSDVMMPLALFTTDLTNESPVMNSLTLPI